MNTMNKNTVQAIQARINRGESDFVIGRNRYVCHYEHPEFEPFVLMYRTGSAEPFNAGNIVDGAFIPDVQPVRREHEGGAYSEMYDMDFDTNPRLYTKEALAAYVRSLSSWGVDNCNVVLAELADRAGILDEWLDADGDTFEGVIRKIQDLLNVDLGL